MAPEPASAERQARIAILGAGSLGQLWAGCLPPGSAVFLSRLSSSSPDLAGKPAPLEYRVQHPEGSATDCTVEVLPVTLIRPELLLVTTKAGDTLPALEQTLPWLDNRVPVVLFQNGLGPQQAIAERWCDRPILAASTTEGANRPRSGLLVHAGRGQTWIGGLTETGRLRVAQAVRQLSGSGLVIHPENDIQQRLWDKLVINAGINAFTAILDCPNGEILAHPLYLENIDKLCEEVSRVMALEANHPLAASDIRNRIQAVATSTANNTSSMRSDLHRGRKTEIDVINGYIVEQGRAEGIATPVNQMLTHRVKELTS
ncbi:ketopantoate reductase family protein [Marinobacter sp.]|uniref:ketopantoate reductase family protein n=1 Tax=Marinobacter sp. TaxID=50741 RepID=UPI002B498C6B|nr:ketopantoate reductase family protein [Marinobacter sp.]HKK57194.1 ketopantoate reductase family protein [Marinobacter sp.]